MSDPKKELKHYNAGNVWGRIAEVKEERSRTNKTPYLAIKLDCPNELHGNIRTYGRLWGKEKIAAFMDHFKKNPGTVYRFQGFFSQYEDEGAIYSNYTFFSWQPTEGTEMRAVFILVGEVMAIEKVEGEGKICLHLERAGQGDYEDTKEDFEIYTPNAQLVDGINAGDMLQVKGALKYKEGEDYFGGTPEGRVKPFVMDMKVVRKREDLESQPY